MSLSDSFQKLKNYIKPGLLALIPVFLGCDTAEDIGVEFELETNVDVKFQEFILPATNLYLDSLRTDSERKAMVGILNDPLTGQITAEGYFQFRFQGGTLPTEGQTSENPFPVDTLSFDSLYIELVPLDFYPSMVTQSVEIVEIADTLISNIIYLSGKQEATQRVIGSFQKEMNLEDDTLLNVRLDQTYGAEFFNIVAAAVRDSTRSISTHSFRDLGLKPMPNTQGVAMFNLAATESRLKLFMSGNADSVYTAFFKITGPNYNHIDRNNGGSPFDGIVEKQDFDLSEGQTVLDPSAGITTAFNIDEISTFFEENSNVLINAAVLDFELDNSMSRDTVDAFRFYFRKSDGGIFGPAIEEDPFANMIMSDNGYLSRSVVPALAEFNDNKEGNSTIPTLFFQSLYRNYNNTGGNLVHIEPLQADTIPISEFVLISPVDVTLQQSIFKNDGIKLRIYYTEVD